MPYPTYDIAERLARRLWLGLDDEIGSAGKRGAYVAVVGTNTILRRGQKPPPFHTRLPYMGPIGPLGLAVLLALEEAEVPEDDIWWLDYAAIDLGVLLEDRKSRIVIALGGEAAHQIRKVGAQPTATIDTPYQFIEYNEEHGIKGNRKYPLAQLIAEAVKQKPRSM